jgi:hypothetical protein
MGQARSFIETKNFVTGLRTTTKAAIHAIGL